MTTFTPVSTFECSERDWAMKLGMLDWDDTRIIFTKRELLNFLKYTGTSVDPNFGTISKLPKYCTFAKVEGDFNKAGADPAAGGSSSFSSDFVPTRRVRDPPGGKTSISFDDNPDDDALAGAPTKSNQTLDSFTETGSSVTEEPAASESGGLPAPTGIPTRRVREPPGGKDSLKSFWDPVPEEEFKPSRRYVWQAYPYAVSLNQASGLVFAISRVAKTILGIFTEFIYAISQPVVPNAITFETFGYNF